MYQKVYLSKVVLFLIKDNKKINFDKNLRSKILTENIMVSRNKLKNGSFENEHTIQNNSMSKISQSFTFNTHLYNHFKQSIKTETKPEQEKADRLFSEENEVLIKKLEDKIKILSNKEKKDSPLYYHQLSYVIFILK